MYSSTKSVKKLFLNVANRKKLFRKVKLIYLQVPRRVSFFNQPSALTDARSDTVKTAIDRENISQGRFS